MALNLYNIWLSEKKKDIEANGREIDMSLLQISKEKFTNDRPNLNGQEMFDIIHGFKDYTKDNFV